MIKKVIQKHPFPYIMDIKVFGHQVVELTLELADIADEENIKKAVDSIIENIKQNYEEINYTL